MIAIKGRESQYSLQNIIQPAKNYGPWNRLRIKSSMRNKSDIGPTGNLFRRRVWFTAGVRYDVTVNTTPAWINQVTCDRGRDTYFKYVSKVSDTTDCTDYYSQVRSTRKHRFRTWKMYAFQKLSRHWRARGVFRTDDSRTGSTIFRGYSPRVCFARSWNSSLHLEWVLDYAAKPVRP